MNILVIAAHPDDEVLGCGGTIARHAASGDRVDILILGEGMMSRADTRNDIQYRERLADLRENSRKACSILGASDVVHYDFPDNRMDSVDLLDIIRTAEGCIEQLRPEVIYAHHIGDLNIDHAVVAKAVITATRPLPGNLIPEVYAFEVLSSTEWSFGSVVNSFRPNYFIGINDYLDKKIDAMSVYQSETKPFPHPRSVEAIRALALHRGSQSGLKAAEAFMLLRKIVR